MSGNILPFRKPKEHLSYKERMKRDALMKQTTEAFARKVDYNVNRTTGHWYEYVSKLLEWIYQSIVVSQWRYTNIDTYMRLDYQIQDCNIFECIRIIKEIDEYLERIHVQESPEKDFFIYIRNKAFILKNDLKNTQSNHLSDSQN